MSNTPSVRDVDSTSQRLLRGESVNISHTGGGGVGSKYYVTLLFMKSTAHCSPNCTPTQFIGVTTGAHTVEFYLYTKLHLAKKIVLAVRRTAPINCVAVQFAETHERFFLLGAVREKIVYKWNSTVIRVPCICSFYSFVLKWWFELSTVGKFGRPNV